METRTTSILQLKPASDVNLAQAVGYAVGINEDGELTLGGDFGVVTAAYQGLASVALFGGNTGPCQVKLSSAIKAGQFLVRDAATGKFKEALSSDIASARAVESGEIDELVAAILLAPETAIGADSLVLANHNHDADYAAIDHNHDADYAAIDHDHDADYAAIDHDHDAEYAAINHNHDGVYQPVSG